jgi:hypothetical protein
VDADSGRVHTVRGATSTRLIEADSLLHGKELTPLAMRATRAPPNGQKPSPNAVANGRACVRACETCGWCVGIFGSHGRVSRKWTEMGAHPPGTPLKQTTQRLLPFQAHLAQSAVICADLPEGCAALAGRNVRKAGKLLRYAQAID